MRLLIDAHIFDEAPEGIRTYIKGIYTEVIARRVPGLQLFFCARDVQNLEKEFGRHPGVQYIALRWGGSAARLSVEMSWLVLKYKIDAVHYQYIAPLLKFGKEIVTTHDVLFLDYPSYFPMRFRVSKTYLFKRSAKRADLLLTVSPSARQSISHHFNIPARNIHITPNGVATDFLQTGDTTSADALREKYGIRKFLLYVSRIEPRKNQVLLLRAFHELGLWHQGYDLVFIGRKDMTAQAFNDYLTDWSESSQYVKVLHNIPHNDLLTFYKATSLFVYPSLAEGFGIPPLEASVAGAPVVCSNRTSMQDFDFYTNDLFDPDDLPALKEKILYKLSHPDPEKIRNIQHAIQTRYRWASSAETLLDLLATL